MTAWWLSDACLVNAWLTVVAWWLPSDCLMTAWWLLNYIIRSCKARWKTTNDNKILYGAEFVVPFFSGSRSQVVIKWQFLLFKMMKFSLKRSTFYSIRTHIWLRKVIWWLFNDDFNEPERNHKFRTYVDCKRAAVRSQSIKTALSEMI